MASAKRLFRQACTAHRQALGHTDAAISLLDTAVRSAVPRPDWIDALLPLPTGNMGWAEPASDEQVRDGLRALAVAAALHTGPSGLEIWLVDARGSGEAFYPLGPLSEAGLVADPLISSTALQDLLSALECRQQAEEQGSQAQDVGVLPQRLVLIAALPEELDEDTAQRLGATLQTAHQQRCTFAIAGLDQLQLLPQASISQALEHLETLNTAYAQQLQDYWRSADPAQWGLEVKQQHESLTQRPAYLDSVRCAPARHDAAERGVALAWGVRGFGPLHSLLNDHQPHSELDLPAAEILAAVYATCLRYSPDDVAVYLWGTQGAFAHALGMDLADSWLPHARIIAESPDAEQCGDFIDALIAEVSARREALRQARAGSLGEWSASGAHGAFPRLLVVIDDVAQMVQQVMDEDPELCAELIALVQQLLTEDTGLGIHLVMGNFAQARPLLVGSSRQQPWGPDLVSVAAASTADATLLITQNERQTSGQMWVVSPDDMDTVLEDLGGRLVPGAARPQGFLGGGYAVGDADATWDPDVLLGSGSGNRDTATVGPRLQARSLTSPVSATRPSGVEAHTSAQQLRDDPAQARSQSMTLLNVATRQARELQDLGSALKLRGPSLRPESTEADNADPAWHLAEATRLFDHAADLGNLAAQRGLKPQLLPFLRTRLRNTVIYLVAAAMSVLVSMAWVTAQPQVASWKVLTAVPAVMWVVALAVILRLGRPRIESHALQARDSHYGELSWRWGFALCFLAYPALTVFLMVQARLGSN